MSQHMKRALGVEIMLLNRHVSVVVSDVGVISFKG